MSDRRGVQRREVLMASSALVGASLLGPAGRVEGAPQSEGLIPDLPDGFSLAERDRRWARVRAAMRREGFDCLLTPAAGGEGGADSRYLTQRSGWVVFPLEGRVVLVADGGDRRARGEWADDVRGSEDGLWSPGVIEALRDAKPGSGRVGVGRLSGVVRNLEGEVSFTTLQQIREAFPGARFESAADLLLRVKLVRGEEEIAVMERATAAGERGLEVLFESARPGRPHHEVWIQVFSAMTAATGERPARLALRAGDEANTSGGGPLVETLQAGQTMNQEVAAQVLSYMAQVNHSFLVGPPPPADWESAAKYCIDVFHEMVEWIRPGKLFIDLCQLYADRARARSPELEPRWVLVHTCGLGDGPRMGLMRDETRDLVIERDMVFTIKPRILVKGSQPTAQFGDPLLVTEQGARRLGRRALELVRSRS